MKITGQIEYEDGATTQFEISSESQANWVQWSTDRPSTAGRSVDVLDALIAEAPNELRVWVSRVALADMSEDAFAPGDPIGSLEWWRNGRWELVELRVCER